MTDYLITNSGARLGGIEDASLPGSFDPVFADHAVRFSEAEEAGLELPPINDLWVHADLFYDDFDLTLDGDGFHWLVSVPNADIAMVDLSNGGRTFYYASGSDISPVRTGGQANAIPNATRFTLDVHIETGATVNGSIDGYRVTWYVNVGLPGQVEAICNSVNGHPPTRFAFGGLDYLDGNARFFVSNVLVSNQDTRGRRFRILRPTGPGALASAVGGWAELGDGDPATFAYARAAGDAVTSTLTPGATPPGTIGRLVLASHARNGSQTPNPGRIVNRLRIGGANHDAAPQAPAGASIEALTSEWATNPATGQPWTWSDLASLEIGFEGQS